MDALKSGTLTVSLPSHPHFEKNNAKRQNQHTAVPISNNRTAFSVIRHHHLLGLVTALTLGSHLSLDVVVMHARDSSNR